MGACFGRVIKRGVLQNTWSSLQAIDIVGLDSQCIPRHMCDESKMASSTGQKLGSSITKSRFLDILDRLTAATAVQLDFFENR